MTPARGTICVCTVLVVALLGFVATAFALGTSGHAPAATAPTATASGWGSAG